MSIWNKVLVGLIVLACLGFLYLAMSALKTHQYWGVSVQKHEKRIAELTDQIEKTRYGDLQEDGAGGLRAARRELHKYLIGRGRVWYRCSPQKFDAQTGQGSVGVDQPVPHGIAEKTILYVFEEKGPAEGGRFLGEFKVLQVGDKLIGVEPTLKRTPQELKQLVESRGPWTLRERLPIDSPDMFADLGKEELAKMVPADRVDAYAKKDQEGPPRPLRDYRTLIRGFDKDRTTLTERQERVARYLQGIDKSLAEAKALVQGRQTELTALAAALKEATRERDAAVAYQKALAAEITQRKARIEELLTKNRALADQIAKLQTEAVKEIDQRTAVVR